jgi:hypothetical protein
VAADLDLAAAELIAQVESAAENAAAAGLLALVGMLPPGTVRAVAVVVKAVFAPDHLAGILRSHAWMHAAEGVLYRRPSLPPPQGADGQSVPLSNPHCRPQSGPSPRSARPPGRPWRRPEKTPHAPSSRC